MRPLLSLLACLSLTVCAAAPLAAQTPALVPFPAPSGPVLEPFHSPSPTPAQLALVAADARLEAATVQGGGSAFAEGFTDDGTLLSDNNPAVQGRAAIAAAAHWSPAGYRLTWQMDGARLLPGDDTGYTWGRYTATTTPPAAAPGGTPHVQTGRYVLLWSRRNDTWQVALATSAADPQPLH